MTLALLRAAYWLHFRDRSFCDGWNSPASEGLFFLLVLAAIVSGGIAVGGLFQRMRLAAVIVVGGMLALSFVAMLLFGSAVL